MTDGKLYLLAEFLVKPELLEETKEVFSKLLPTVLKEPGCEAIYTTSIDSDPSKLVFFESFSSEEAHKFHMAQDYTHGLAVDLESKLAGPMKVTKLNAF
ncbi:putative quinol monooxygenase [Acidicapsa ligni]|uniref:putative quinol monooxygenase n=1 Tax=Acidicapsa ligni TaxID=542300 RepID=UPI0021DF8E49|nr:antibiotic biosynthesis monooxygenase [Acidicapsa ligni]